MPQRTDDYYESASLWHRPPEAYQLQVIADLRQLIPGDVASVLDVGCGDGLVMSAVPSSVEVVGIDGSREALRHVPRPKVHGSVVELPFQDRSFDLVMANDVLEHLDDEGLAGTLAEMHRVAASYVLITVPLREQLARSSARCSHCGAVVHANRHLRSFAESDLLALAGAGFVALELRYSGGVLGPAPDPFATQLLKERVDGFELSTVCPVCGARPPATGNGGGDDPAALDAARAKRWWGRDPAAAAHVDRSEAIVLFARGSRGEVASTRESGVRRVHRDLLEIDLANPLQIVDEWLIGATFARARLCGTTRLESGVACSGGPAAWIECSFPIESRPGDSVELEFDGSVACQVLTWDGAIGEERPLDSVDPSGRRFMIAFDPTPGRTGQVVNVYLGSDTRLRRVRLRAAGVDTSIPAFELDAGHAIAVLAHRPVLVTWGIHTGSGGTLPAPRWPIDSEGPATTDSPVLADILGCSAQIRVRSQRRARGFLDRVLEADRMRADAEQAHHTAVSQAAAARSELDASRRDVERLTRLLSDGRRVQTVLVCASWFPSDLQPGLGSFVFEQVRALRQLTSIDARVVCGRPFWVNTRRPKRILAAWREYRARLSAARWSQREGVPRFEFPYLAGAAVSWMSTAANYRRALRAIEPVVHRDFDYDLVHAHTAYVDGSAALAIARMRGVPCVVTEHTGPFEGLMRHPIVRRRTLATIRDADHVWAVSEALLAEMRRWLGEPSPMNLSVLHNGIDTGDFVPPDVEPTVESGATRFGAIGVFEEVKNPLLLIDAFHAARAQLPRSTLTLVGDGPLEPVVRARVAERGLGTAVQFRGRLTRPQLAAFLRDDVDVLVVASRVETFGMVIIEAMACGRPVVATRCGGPEDVITSAVFGTLVANGDVAALTTGMVDVARRIGSFDRTAIRSHVLENFGLDRLANRLTHQYQLIARAHSGSRGATR